MDKAAQRAGQFPLSRDHHGSLILARLLQKDAPAYKDLPDTIEGKRDYAIELFDKDIRPHFEKEEKLYNAILHYPELHEPLRKILQEHKELILLFAGLKQRVSSEDLHHAGALLEKHIRFEERELFPLMEKVCTEEELLQWS
ncbi:MAG: hemerythrin domain-containing protein [Chitinophagaceae bacterium]|nr:MAG: hemerythrin domain-containing protein [Chitinophagaceae bacterium]